MNAEKASRKAERSRAVDTPCVTARVWDSALGTPSVPSPTETSFPWGGVGSPHFVIKVYFLIAGIWGCPPQVKNTGQSSGCGAPCVTPGSTLGTEVTAASWPHSPYGPITTAAPPRSHPLSVSHSFIPSHVHQIHPTAVSNPSHIHTPHPIPIPYPISISIPNP